MRPLLVGEDNPLSSDPRHALWPAPVNCAGWRLCHKVLDLGAAQYLAQFDRVNLCAGAWDAREAMGKAEFLAVRALATGSALVLLGAKVAKAFNLKYVPFSSYHPGYTIAVLPHPSGRSRAWNEPGACARARDFLRANNILR